MATTSTTKDLVIEYVNTQKKMMAQRTEEKTLLIDIALNLQQYIESQGNIAQKLLGMLGEINALISGELPQSKEIVQYLEKSNPSLKTFTTALQSNPIPPNLRLTLEQFKNNPM